MGFKHDRWKLGTSLGEGGQGWTNVATDATGAYDKVVVKRLKNASRAGRFRREVEALKKLKHPNIVEIIDHAPLDAESDLFLVMQYLEGGDLAHRPKLYKDAPDTTLAVAAALTDALAYAHAHGVVHRDVKPANILFASTTEHACVLADFGICYADDGQDLTDSRDWMGPRAYIAKELEGGGSPTAPAADVYALGKVIYFMLSGGVDLPREEHRTARFDIFCGGNAKMRAIGLLLDKMICSIESRLPTMDLVREQLQHIRAMDLESVAAPMEADVFADIVRRIDADASRKREDDTRTAMVQDNRRRVATVIGLVKPVVRTTLENLAKRIPPTDAHTLTLERDPIGDPQLAALSGMGIHGLFYVEHEEGLVFVRERGGAKTRHVFRVVLCRNESPLVAIGADRPNAEDEGTVSVVPSYLLSGQPSMRSYIVAGESATRLNQNFKAGVHLRLDFKPSEWPARQEEVKKLVGDAFGRFMQVALSEGGILVAP